MTIKLDYELPEYPAFEAGIRRAPRRESHLTEADKALAIKNALRYIHPDHHEQMAKEFAQELEEHGRISTSLDDSVFLILSSGMKFNNQHLTGVGMYKLPDYFLKEEIYNGYLTNHFIRRFGNMYIDSKNQRVVLFDSPQDSTSLLVTDLQEVVQKLKQGIYEYRTKKNNSLLQRVFRK